MACVPRHRSGRTLRPREPGFEQRILGDFNCRGRTQKHIRGRASRRSGLQLRSADPKSVCSAVFGGKVFLSPTPLRGRYLNDAIKGMSRRPAPMARRSTSGSKAHRRGPPFAATKLRSDHSLPSERFMMNPKVSAKDGTSWRTPGRPPCVAQIE